MKDRKKKRVTTAKTEGGRENRQNGTQKRTDSDFKITTRQEREKKIRMDTARSQSESICLKLFGSNNHVAFKILEPALFVIFYALNVKNKRETPRGGFLANREKRLKEWLHSLAETLPQLICDRLTVALFAGSMAIACVALMVTGNLLWFIFAGLGVLSLVGSMISLRFGIKGCVVGMLLFGVAVVFFFQTKVIHRGLPELYELFQLW